MKRRYLVRLIPKIKSDTLPKVLRSIGRNLGVEVKNPKWTTYGALEIDLFSLSSPDIDVFLAAIEPISMIEFVHDLSSAEQYQSRERIIEKARSYFNSERFWECHELLEQLWRNSDGDEKRLLQSMILICAAFVHIQKGEEKIALGILKRAINGLEWKDESYHGIDIRQLRGSIELILLNNRFEIVKI